LKCLLTLQPGFELDPGLGAYLAAWL
jgi:hypothetical protein